MFINYNLKETASTELRIITNEKNRVTVTPSNPTQSNLIQSMDGSNPCPTLASRHGPCRPLLIPTADPFFLLL